MHRATGPYEVALAGFTFAPIDKSRIKELADVFVSGYEGTVDYEDETQEDGEKYLRNVFSDAWGDFLEAFSWVALDGTAVAGICIALLHRQLAVPFVAFLVTKSEYKRQGIGRALMLKCIDSLHGSGIGEAILFVTDTNYQAIALYESLGFAAEDL